MSAVFLVCIISISCYAKQGEKEDAMSFVFFFGAARCLVLPENKQVSMERKLEQGLVAVGTDSRSLYRSFP